VYDSFDFIPLTILDNAIKYSLERQDICIHVEDREQGVYVAIESFGPIVPPSETCKIFDRGYRGTNSLKLHKSGSGIGLWIAKKVAEVHGFIIRYKAEPKTFINGTRVGLNRFFFTVYSVDYEK